METQAVKLEHFTVPNNLIYISIMPCKQVAMGNHTLEKIDAFYLILSV